MRYFWILICVLWAAVTPAAHAQTITPDTWDTALATPGAQLLQLAPGVYPAADVTGLRGPLTIRAADPADPPQLRGLTLTDAADIRFEGVHFVAQFARGDPAHMRRFAIKDSRRITFDRVSFTGDLGADGFPTGFGLTLSGSTDITVQNSRIAGFIRGMVVDRSHDIAILDTEITGMRSDGLNFAQVQRVTIRGNHIHDFTRDLSNDDHADMIQFWTNGTDAPSTDIIIADNLLSAGGGHYTQSIFMRNDRVDRGLAGPEMFYKNVSITGNVILNAHLHGITLGETDGLRITRNTVVRNADASGPRDDVGLWTPQIRVAQAARDVTITGNITSLIAGVQPAWTVTGNLMVQDQDPESAGYYGDVFGANAITDPTIPAHFRARGDVGAPQLAK